MIDKIAFILIQNQTVLSTRTRGKEVFYIPGGKRELGETDEQTLIREVKEELNVDIKPDSISYLETFTAQSHGAKKGVMVKMTCYTATFVGSLKASNEIAELRWLHYEHMDIISEVDKKIFNYLKSKKLLK
jgi:8-oxo-dGTP pyrophosphatase MutT (NUDIX family)